MASFIHSFVLRFRFLMILVNVTLRPPTVKRMLWTLDILYFVMMLFTHALLFVEQGESFVICLIFSIKFIIFFTELYIKKIVTWFPLDLFLCFFFVFFWGGVLFFLFSLSASIAFSAPQVSATQNPNHSPFELWRKT